MLVETFAKCFVAISNVKMKQHRSALSHKDGFTAVLMASDAPLSEQQVRALVTKACGDAQSHIGTIVSFSGGAVVDVHDTIKKELLE